MDQFFARLSLPLPFLVSMYISMYGEHLQQSMDQPRRFANPARG